MRRIQIDQIDGPNDILYVEGSVDGVPFKTSVKRSEIEEAPTLEEKRAIVARSLLGQDVVRQRGRYATLLGAFIFEDTPPLPTPR